MFLIFPLFFHVCFSLSLTAFCVMSNVRLFPIATMTISKQHKGTFRTYSLFLKMQILFSVFEQILVHT